VGRFSLPHPQNPEKQIEMLCVNESGLYNVILRSDKQEAKPFRKMNVVFATFLS
jgi:prophage antirepressor-like protein